MTQAYSKRLLAPPALSSQKDPADRVIVALARRLNAPPVTADENIRASKYVRTLW